MKKHAGNIWISILFVAGFSLLLYPMAANEWNSYRQTQLIGDYDEVLAQKELAGTLDYQAEKEAAVSYNEALLPSILPDSFAVAEASEEDAAYRDCLILPVTGVGGSVEILKLYLSLPVFHTTSVEVLVTASGL